jgi:hypothetical protein
LHIYCIYVYIIWLWILVRVGFLVWCWKGEDSMRALLCAALCNWSNILRTSDDEGLFEEALRHPTIHQRGGKEAISLNG